MNMADQYIVGFTPEISWRCLLFDSRSSTGAWGRLELHRGRGSLIVAPLPGPVGRGDDERLDTGRLGTGQSETIINL